MCTTDTVMPAASKVGTVLNFAAQGQNLARAALLLVAVGIAVWFWPDGIGLLFGLAIAYRRRSDFHKRYMLLASLGRIR